MSSPEAVGTFLLCGRCFWSHRRVLLLRCDVDGAGADYGSDPGGAGLLIPVDDRVMMMRVAGRSCRSPRERRLGGIYLGGRRRF